MAHKLFYQGSLNGRDKNSVAKVLEEKVSLSPQENFESLQKFEVTYWIMKGSQIIKNLENQGVDIEKYENKI